MAESISERESFLASRLKILFVCDANRLRSPTAEAIFTGRPHLDVKSAGLAKQATVPLTVELLEWADIIFVMEKRQRNVIQSRFKEIYRHKRIICLYIPDDFEFMDRELIRLLEERVSPYLNSDATAKGDE
jgi:predicted protein tyrosine phosphatase